MKLLVYIFCGKWKIILRRNNQLDKVLDVFNEEEFENVIAKMKLQNQDEEKVTDFKNVTPRGIVLLL